jgi:cardiolipin synthase
VDLFAALIEAVDAAHHEVHLETYIFRFEGAGADVAHALMRAAQRGVQVRVVVDGVGTGELPAPWAERWTQAGVQVRVFAPAVGLGFWLPSRWRRLHRKLCVVDNTVAFCGGINILDDYLDPHVHGLLTAPRLDYAVSLRGPLVAAVRDTMTQLWSRIEAVRELRSQDLSGALDALRGTDQRLRSPMRGETQLVLRDNVLHRTHIERTYRRPSVRRVKTLWWPALISSRADVCGAGWCSRLSGVCVCACCCRGSMSIFCPTAQRVSCTVSSWRQGWRSMSTTPVSCMPRWRWSMASG